MDLKTHTGYPEILVDEAFEWVLADETGSVDHPSLVPKGAEITTVYPWVAKILGRPETSFKDFVDTHGGDPKEYDSLEEYVTDKGGKLADLEAPVLDSFIGVAASRKEAIDEARAEIATVQDEYLRGTE